MKKSLILLSSAVLLGVAFYFYQKSKSSIPTISDTKHQISLRFDWIPTMSFCGDIVAQKKIASKYNIELKLESAAEGVDPIKMVVSGTNEFGIVSLERLLMANEKGADLVAIAIVNDVSPAVFLAKKDKNINTPKDFEGHRVGIQSGGATEFVYRALVKKCGLDQSKIKEVQIGFDMNTFVAGNTFDIRPGFIYDEACYLDFQNIPYTMIEPVKFGLKFPGRVYFTTRKLIQGRPELVQAFINSIAEGWLLTIQDNQMAIKLLKEFEPSVDTSREAAGLRKGIDYFRGFNNKVLMPDTIAWRGMVNDLNSLGVIKETNFEKYVDLDFINNFHNSFKTN